jgi:hypothetical protein
MREKVAAEGRRMRATGAVKSSVKPAQLPSSFVKRRQVLSRVVKLFLDGLCCNFKGLARQSLTNAGRVKRFRLSRPFVSRLNAWRRIGHEDRIA